MYDSDSCRVKFDGTKYGKMELFMCFLWWKQMFFAQWFVILAKFYRKNWWNYLNRLKTVSFFLKSRWTWFLRLHNGQFRFPTEYEKKTGNKRGKNVVNLFFLFQNESKLWYGSDNMHWFYEKEETFSVYSHLIKKHIKIASI